MAVRVQTTGPKGPRQQQQDTLSLFYNGGRRLQQMTVDTQSRSEVTLPLPGSVYQPSVLVVLQTPGGCDGHRPTSGVQLQPADFEVKGEQVVVRLPAGQVRVQTPQGNTLVGQLEQLEPNRLALTSSADGQLYRIANYTRLEFLGRHVRRHLTVSYLLSGLEWTADHLVLIDQDTDGLRLWKTSALLSNTTGLTFDLDNLRLVMAAPRLGQHRLQQTAATRAERKLGVAAEASDDDGEQNEARIPQMRALAAAPAPASGIERAQVQMDDDEEDQAAFDVGPQTLRESAKLSILTVDPAASAAASSIALGPQAAGPKDWALKFYSQQLGPGNQSVAYGYQFALPSVALLPRGSLRLYYTSSCNKSSAPTAVAVRDRPAGTSSSLLGNYIGTVQLPSEHRGASARPLEVMLGQSSVVAIATTVEEARQRFKVRHRRGREPRFRHEATIPAKDAQLVADDSDGDPADREDSANAEIDRAFGGNEQADESRGDTEEEQVVERVQYRIQSRVTNNGRRKPAHVRLSFADFRQDQLVRVRSTWSRPELFAGTLAWYRTLAPGESVGFVAELITESASPVPVVTRPMALI